MSGVAVATGLYMREHVRTRLTLVMLVVIPAVFVWTAAQVLSQFAAALGGSLAGSAAAALSAGWAAAFLAGALGFFQVTSSRGADRRLALAGLGALRVAAARLLTALLLAVLVSAVAFGTLLARQGIPHPAHAAFAILAYAVIYMAIGTAVGSVISGQLEGSVAVIFIFLFDVFNGPGMTKGGGLTLFLTPTRKAAELLAAAGGGQTSLVADWIGAALTAGVAVLVAGSAFFLAARPRG